MRPQPQSSFGMTQNAHQQPAFGAGFRPPDGGMYYSFVEKVNCVGNEFDFKFDGRANSDMLITNIVLKKR